MFLDRFVFVFMLLDLDLVPAKTFFILQGRSHFDGFLRPAAT
jgi:hypothetical protein